jgi:hypothetical protein
MSIYKELNDVTVDLSEFEEHELTKLEKKRILKRVKKGISPRRHQGKWLTAAIGAAAVMLSIVIIIDKDTVADMPFIGEEIEKYINANENLDYSSYKTAIGSTAENELGKLTLNEVMVDDQQIFLSSTFEPAHDVDFNYQTTITPKMKINGEDYTVTTGGQSIELNNRMFTIFNDIELSEAIDTEKVEIEISYDRWEFDTAIEEPWTFIVEVNQSQLMQEKKAFEMQKQLTMNTGDIITIEKVVTTPISTTVYYDLSQSSSEDIHFKILSKDGVVEYNSSMNSNKPGDLSYTRFNGFTLEGQGYSLMIFNSDNEELIDQAVPVK